MRKDHYRKENKDEMIILKCMLRTEIKLDLTGSEQGPTVAVCQYGDVHLGSTGEKKLDLLNSRSRKTLYVDLT
jgi:hypothetical protein